MIYRNYIQCKDIKEIIPPFRTGRSKDTLTRKQKNNRISKHHRHAEEAAIRRYHYIIREGRPTLDFAIHGSYYHSDRQNYLDEGFGSAQSPQAYRLSHGSIPLSTSFSIKDLRPLLRLDSDQLAPLSNLAGKLVHWHRR